MSLKIFLLGKNLSRQAQNEEPDIKKITRSVKARNHQFLSNAHAKCYAEDDNVQDSKNIQLSSDQSFLVVSDTGAKLYSALKSINDGVAFVVPEGEQIVAHAGRYGSEGSAAGGDNPAASGGVFLHVGPKSVVKRFEGRISLQGNNLPLGAVAAVVKVMRGRELLD